ncbi:MAG: hypothetical protein WC222_06970 [Parachlamydiales bacterium]|jgi:hypothetical protein
MKNIQFSFHAGPSSSLLLLLLTFALFSSYTLVVAEEKICSFSSFTKGCYEVVDVFVEEDTVQITLCLPIHFRKKIEKRKEKFKSSALSLDGVYAEILYSDSAPDNSEYYTITARVCKIDYSNSTLTQISSGDRVSIGMLSKNPHKWLLNGTPVGTVKLVEKAIAKDHLQTKELLFECSEEIFAKIKNLEYIGLNASGLTIVESYNTAGRYFFSIHAGKTTIEKTKFDDEVLPLGTKFTLTLPASAAMAHSSSF